MKTREVPERHSTAGRRRHRLAHRGGAVLVFVALGLVVFLGMAALAIDLGLLYVARGEAQRAADAAAHAGAGFYQLNRERPNAVQATRDFVVEFAENNEVRGLPVRVDGQQDIDVLPDESLIRVRVRRTDDGIDGPIPTLFARVLGFQEVGVSASAAAQIFQARQAECILPIALPDRFERRDGQPVGPNEVFNDSIHFYDRDLTGYQLPRDLGLEIFLRPDADDDRITPSWWNTVQSRDLDFAVPGTSGLEAAIRACDDAVFGEDEELDQASGNRASLWQPNGGAWESLIGSDRPAGWEQFDPGSSDPAGCVTYGDGECRASPRVRPVVFFDPSTDITGPTTTIPVTKLLGLFIESQFSGPPASNSQVTARISSVPSLTPGDIVAGPGTLLTGIRIVE